MSDLETLKAQHPGVKLSVELAFKLPEDLRLPHHNTIATLVALVQHHEAELAKAQETISEQQRRLEQQDKRLDHFESIGVDAYDHARELMEKAQRERSDRGVDVGTTGSLCDGIAWVYRRLAFVEADLAAAQATIQQQARELEEARQALGGAIAWMEVMEIPHSEPDYMRAVAAFKGHSARAQQESEAKKEVPHD